MYTSENERRNGNKDKPNKGDQGITEKLFMLFRRHPFVNQALTFQARQVADAFGELFVALSRLHAPIISLGSGSATLHAKNGRTFFIVVSAYVTRVYIGGPACGPKSLCDRHLRRTHFFELRARRAGFEVYNGEHDEQATDR